MTLTQAPSSATTQAVLGTRLTQALVMRTTTVTTQVGSQGPWCLSENP